MSNEPCSPLILALDDASAQLEQVGGKGASLARLASAGLPVPPGFSITTDAYRRFVTEHRLQERILAAASVVVADQPATLGAASSKIGSLFAQSSMPDDIAETIRQAYAELGGGNLSVAVRSSATAEDLPEMSFAGQQESYLNMQGEVRVLEAVKRCWASLWTARAIGYRARYHIAPADVSLAVVVQELVPADAAGVLFTANPLTGGRDQVLINAAWGLGEAIIGGQVTPDTILVEKVSGVITKQEIAEKTMMTVRTLEGTHEEPVPAEKRTVAVLSPAQAAELARVGVQIEQLYGQPMDIEWALHAGRFFIVQARPITALHAQVPLTEEWNDSLTGDFLWTNANLGEAAPDVMTPCTWSLMQVLMEKAMAMTTFNGYHLVGNIGGRSYMNLSLLATIARSFGMGQKRFKDVNEAVFGRIPDNLEVPLVPMSRWSLLRVMLPEAVRILTRVRTYIKKLPTFLEAAQTRCEKLQVQIQEATRPADLLALWQNDLAPFFYECCYMLQAAGRQDGNALIYVRLQLRKLVGETDANVLLSRQSELESLGPLLSLSQLARGEIDRATFVRQYGHRGPHEFEVSLPRPVEDPDWIERQLIGLCEAPVNVNTLLARQKDVQAAAWEHFRQRYPRRVAKIQRQIDKATTAFRDREATRSEVIRVFWALRAFVLRAGELSGQGEDLFFLTISEILAVLGGDQAPLASIAARRATYERYCTLPPYPVLICGRFDPFKWAADPQRRGDLFDARGNSIPASDTITGFPGAVGVVEGLARVIATADEGDQLQPGEILVTTVTNVGWTPLFPRAAAIVTDVGAPLSHAAIVARELGIPAVVGCGNATMRLHTGDRVRVNGGQGTVEVLRTASVVSGNTHDTMFRHA